VGGEVDSHGAVLEFHHEVVGAHTVHVAGPNLVELAIAHSKTLDAAKVAIGRVRAPGAQVAVLRREEEPIAEDYIRHQISVEIGERDGLVGVDARANGV
jgi:hypothetical protein